jgi:hypothetical protein
MYCRTALFSIVALSSAACTHTTREVHHVRDSPSATADEANDPLVVRRYEVPAGSAGAMRSMLTRLFSRKAGALARVAISPDGHVVVSGPASIQKNVAEVIAATKVAPASPTSSVAITYWIVEGRPASEGKVDPALAEIAAPLQRVDSTFEWRPVERLTLRSANDVTAAYEARSAEVRQTIHQSDDRIVAELHLRHHGPRGSELTTRVELRPDAPVVVGTVELDAEATGERPTLYYVVRASRAAHGRDG